MNTGKQCTYAGAICSRGTVHTDYFPRYIPIGLPARIRPSASAVVVSCHSSPLSAFCLLPLAATSPQGPSKTAPAREKVRRTAYHLLRRDFVAALPPVQPDRLPKPPRAHGVPLRRGDAPRFSSSVADDKCSVSRLLLDAFFLCWRGASSLPAPLASSPHIASSPHVISSVTARAAAPSGWGLIGRPFVSGTGG